MLSNIFGFVFYIALSIITLSSFIKYYGIKNKSPFLIFIFTVIIIGYVVKPYMFHLANKNPLQNEMFKVTNIDYNIDIQDDGSATVEHIVKLHKNRESVNPKEQIIHYVFDEVGEIANLNVSVDSKSLEEYSSGGINTFNLKSNSNKKSLAIYPPFITEDDFVLKISYLAKNPLILYSDTEYTYYNTLLSERSGFSYNTNTKGSINFNLPENSKFDVGAHSKSLYLVEKNRTSNNVSFYFENRLTYENNPFSNGIALTGERYDPLKWSLLSDNNSYLNDYSILTRLVFTPINSEKMADISILDKNKYSVYDLKALNIKNNKDNYSDVLFVIGWIGQSFITASAILLILTMPFVRSYGRRSDKNLFD